jgi:hypothetical protein
MNFFILQSYYKVIEWVDMLCNLFNNNVEVVRNRFTHQVYERSENVNTIVFNLKYDKLTLSELINMIHQWLKQRLPPFF